jgi:hypothetical protein
MHIEQDLEASPSPLKATTTLMSVFECHELQLVTIGLDVFVSVFLFCNDIYIYTYVHLLAHTHVFQDVSY